MTDKSHAKIGRRVKKSKLFPLGWERVNEIDADEIAIISLPGSNTDNSKKANGFAKMIEEMLTDKKIPIYSVEYDTTNRLSIADRIALLKYYNQDTSNNSYQHYHKEDDGYIPNFIYEIYNQTLAPRLRDENGNKVPIKLASQRLNKLVFVNHCQGSTVSFQLERLMIRDMKKLVNMNPDATRQYLKPDNFKMLGMIVAIKLILSIAFLFMARVEGFTGLEAFLFYLVMFTLIYDVCSFYQVCLQIAQSIFIGFLLFMLLLMGGIFLFNYGFAFLANLSPSTATGQNISMIVMALIFMIPLVIDVVRLVKLLKTLKKIHLVANILQYLRNLFYQN